MNTTLRTKLYGVLYCAFGAAALCTLASTAGADIQTPPSKVVKFGDLNITTPAGAKALYHRIQAAAVEVCPLQMSTLQMTQIQRACIDHAIDNAVRSVDSAVLTELRFGSPVRVASN